MSLEGACEAGPVHSLAFALSWRSCLDVKGSHALRLAWSQVDEVGSDSSPNFRSDAFEWLIANHTKRSGKGDLPKFVKRIEDVPEVALPPNETIRVALSLADRALIEQFIGLWPSPKTTNSWVQRNW